MQKNTFYIEIYTNFVQAYTVCIFKTGRDTNRVQKAL